MAAYDVLLVLIVILPLQLTSNEACFINSEDKCRNFADLKGFPFHAFIQQFILEAQCMKLTTALDCILQDAEEQECEPLKTFMFSGQDNVLKAVCGDLKTAYLYSEPCFLKIEAAIQNCTNPITRLRSNEICSTIETARTCVRTTVSDFDYPLCNDLATRTMFTLFDYHIQPMAAAFSCSVKGLAGLGETKSQMSMTTEVSTTTLSAMMSMTTEANTAMLSTMMTSMMPTTMEDMTTKHHNRANSLAQGTPFTWFISMTILTLMALILM